MCGEFKKHFDLEYVNLFWRLISVVKLEKALECLVLAVLVWIEAEV